MEGDAISSVTEAVRHTTDAGMARVSFESVSDMAAMKVPDQPTAHAHGLHGLWGRAKKKGFELWLNQMLKSGGGVMQAEGFLAFESRRCAIDYGAYAVLVHGSSE